MVAGRVRTLPDGGKTRRAARSTKAAAMSALERLVAVSNGKEAPR